MPTKTVEKTKEKEPVDPQGREPEEDLIPDGGQYDGPSEEEEAAMVAADESAAVAPAKQVTGVALFKQQLDKPDFQQAIADNLGEMTKMNVNQVCRVAYQALRGNTRLQECTVPSVLMGVLEAASLHLTISSVLGECYLVPYKRNGVQEAQFMLGFKGKMELARRGGVTQIWATCVYENDEFEVQEGTHREITHKPCEDDNRGALKYVYAVARIKGCEEPTFVVLSKSDVMKRKAASRGASGSSSPWNQWESEMWKKSAIHALAKYLPMDVDSASAFGRDEARDMGRMQGYKQVEQIYRDPSEDALNRIADEG